jgi:hypothetical protein
MKKQHGYPDECIQEFRSYFFTIRMWPEECADGSTEWRGQVRWVINGDTHYFREWTSLVKFLENVLSASMY